MNKDSKKYNNTINNFHPKSLNIIEISSSSSQKKPHSPQIYNTFFAKENTSHSKHHNHSKFLNNFQFKAIGGKSISTDKTNKTKSKFGQYNNYSKHYCITLNQYAQYKQNYLSLNSQTNSKSKSKSKSNSKSGSSRPSTAPQKKKDLKKNNNRAIVNKNNFIGFNGIVNIRTNLINNNNNKNNGLNNNKKYLIKDSNKNNGFNTLFNPSNNFTNNILMNVNNGFNNNKFIMNVGNIKGNSRTLFDGNNRRITSSRIYLNQSGLKNKKQNNGGKIRLSSAIINNNIPLANNSSNKKKFY